MRFPGAGRAEEMHDLGAGHEIELGERQDAIAVERGLEGEVEALDRLGRGEPGGLECDADATGLAGGVLLGQQGVDGVERADLATLKLAHGVVKRFQRTRHAQADEAGADAVERLGHRCAPSPASLRATAS